MFASKKTFDQWKSRQLADPADFVGIAQPGGAAIGVFHDPETTRVFVDDGAGWKRRKGTYVSDGGEHVLFDALLFDEEA